MTPTHGVEEIWSRKPTPLLCEKHVNSPAFALRRPGRPPPLRVEPLQPLLGQGQTLFQARAFMNGNPGWTTFRKVEDAITFPKCAKCLSLPVCWSGRRGCPTLSFEACSSYFCTANAPGKRYCNLLIVPGGSNVKKSIPAMREKKHCCSVSYCYC